MSDIATATSQDVERVEVGEIEPGIYRHYQGGLYRVHGIAYEETTLAPVVVYESFGDSESYPRRSFWTRSFQEFVGLVQLATGELRPRFVREHGYDNWFL